MTDQTKYYPKSQFNTLKEIEMNTKTKVIATIIIAITFILEWAIALLFTFSVGAMFNTLRGELLDKLTKNTTETE